MKKFILILALMMSAASPAMAMWHCETRNNYNPLVFWIGDSISFYGARTTSIEACQFNTPRGFWCGEPVWVIF